MADFSISQLTEDESAADSDLIEVAKDNGDGTFASRKQLRSTLLADKAAQADLDAHEADATNPHSVTKAQIGLSNAENTSDLAKPVSTATQTALDAKANTSHTHTASQVTDFDTEVANNAAVTANTAKNSYPSADATKLAGIESGAEVNEIGTTDIADFETTTELNARDTANRSRTNHTGSQAISTVTGLQTALDAKADDSDIPATIVESVVAGTNVTVDNTDPANPVVSTSGGDGGGGAVDSVNGETGVVVLDQDDIADGTTAKQYTATEKTKLAGIETAATADQTGFEIKTAYEAEANTNAYTDAEKTKLAGVETGAEVNEVGTSDLVEFETTTELNARDTANRDRINHTGAQAITTITGLQSALDGKSATGHSHVEADITDLHSHANQAVLDATTASFTIADETKLDGVASGATANSSDATLLNRTNHTGSQAVSTVTGLQTALDAKLEDVDIADINATGTADDSTYLRGDGSWSTPGGGGGVDSFAKSGETGLTGDVTLSAGDNITLTQSGNDIEIAAAGGGGGGESAPKAIISSVFEDGNIVSTAENIVRWSRDGSATGNIFAATGINLGAAIPSSGYDRLTLRCIATAIGAFDGNTEFFTSSGTYLGSTSSGRKAEVFFGVGNPSVSGTTGITLTDKHFGFRLYSASDGRDDLCTTADGITQSSTSFTAESAIYYLKKEDDAINYYVDGSLVGTLDSNIPTGGNQYPIHFSESNIGTSGGTAVQIPFVTYTKEVL